MGDAWAWTLFFSVIVTIVLLVLNQFVSLTDLDFDHINPYDCASRINKLFLPEFIMQGVLCLLFLLRGHWIMLLLCAPYLYYNARLYIQRQHIIHVTEIFNMRDWEKKQRLCKIIYLCPLLLISFFWLIYSALEDIDE